MASVTSIALSGMQAAQVALNTSAHNVANASTPQFKRQQVVQTEQSEGGVATQLTQSATEGAALEADLVAQKQALYTFLANRAVIQTSQAMTGALLNEKT